MIRHNKSLWALAFALAIALACSVRPASAQLNIGSAAVIKNDVHGVRGSATRVLATGGSVFSDDQVKTGDDSLAQLVFVDQTNLTVAANSQAVLKEVYRPKQGYSQLIMRTVSGSFRYVSGVQSSHRDVVQFPQGYLTVRGTTVDIVAGPSRTLIILVEGAITVVPFATRIPQELSIPGSSLIVYNDGHVDGPMTREAALEKMHLNVASLAVLTQTGIIETPTNFAGLDVGGFVGEGRFSNTYKEFSADTGEETNRNSFGATRVVGGGQIGFMIPVVTNAQGGATALGPFVIEPFVQLEDPNTSAQFNFPGASLSDRTGGTFSVQSDFEVTTGVKAGPTLSPSLGPVWIYVTVAASFENEKLTVNFAPISSSENKTVAGLTVGFGGAIIPNGLQLFGMPIALSVEYQHTFWQTAHFDMPASSPLFDYEFQRDDDKVMAGVHVILRR